MDTETLVDGGGHGGGTATVVATGKEYPDIVRQLGDTLAKLNSVQAHDLRRYMRDEYEIEAPDNSNIETTVITHVTVVEPEQQTSFDVILAGLADPAKKIGVIKIVREATGLGLAESKAFVEAAPKPVKEGLEKADADKLKAALEAAGAKVELK